MRVTSQMRRGQLLYDLERLQTSIFQSQSVLSDGREVTKGSDDPIRARKSLVLRSSLARRDQYLDNLQHGKTRLSMSEAVLMSVEDQLVEVRSLAIKLANEGSVPEERTATAQSIDALLEEMVAQANSRQDGAYLFGGFNTEQPPYDTVRDPDTGEITAVLPQTEFMDGEITVKADQDLNIKININGNEIFQVGSPGDEDDMFQTLINLRDAMRIEDPEASSEIIERSISELDNAMTQVQTGLTDLGGRYNRLQSVEQSHMSLELREQEDLSIAEDGELSEWITRFELQSIALQQAMAVGTQVLNASIVNFIR
jgi:flagellar hook-associated protein 3 FlgL